MTKSEKKKALWLLDELRGAALLIRNEYWQKLHDVYGTHTVGILVRDLRELIERESV